MRMWTLDELDQAEEHSPLISRFTIAILSSLLTGMTFGYTLSDEVRLLTGIAAMLGLVFYIYRSLLVRDRLLERTQLSRRHAEQRLAKLSAVHDIQALTADTDTAPADVDRSRAHPLPR